MIELMQNLKFHVERATNDYILLCSGLQKVSKRRFSDLRSLQRILSTSSADIHTKLAEIKSMLNKMKTGWLFFDFGRSRLKNLVEGEIKKFKKIYINAYISVAKNTQPVSSQKVILIPAIQKNKKENFSVSASINFLQFKPKAIVQNAKPMLKLDTETCLQNIDFLM
jgi:hypothetical protein